MKILRKAKRGIGLLELMLSLAIIALIITMAIRYYQTSYLSQQVNDASSMIQTLQSASQRWKLTHDNYADISVDNLKERNFLPQNFGTNPWGGEVTIAPYNNDVQYEITLTNIPTTACYSLSDRFETQGPMIIDHCSGSDEGSLTNFSVIFQ